MWSVIYIFGAEIQSILVVPDISGPVSCFKTFARAAVARPTNVARALSHRRTVCRQIRYTYIAFHTFLGGLSNVKELSPSRGASRACEFLGFGSASGEQTLFPKHKTQKISTTRERRERAERDMGRGPNAT